MKRLIILALIAAALWKGFGLYQARRLAAPVEAGAEADPVRTGQSVAGPIPSAETQFKCDGRTYCSQMTSCAEATYFLRTCPGVKMDGNNDGIPCEQQWCKP
ncbi:MAG: excalibur calcium-binding domain-containing protein [Burkholderiaceae bacterium]|nr:excalibur calcium-binding domain-containing protein [Burkholderiaceae bacterium]